jgi:hypothetical protein
MENVNPAVARKGARSPLRRKPNRKLRRARPNARSFCSIVLTFQRFNGLTLPANRVLAASGEIHRAHYAARESRALCREGALAIQPGIACVAPATRRAGL